MTVALVVHSSFIKLAYPAELLAGICVIFVDEVVKVRMQVPSGMITGDKTLGPASQQCCRLSLQDRKRSVNCEPRLVLAAVINWF